MKSISLIFDYYCYNVSNPRFASRTMKFLCVCVCVCVYVYVYFCVFVRISARMSTQVAQMQAALTAEALATRTARFAECRKRRN
jgi:hypothetical protein